MDIHLIATVMSMARWSES